MSPRRPETVARLRIRDDLQAWGFAVWDMEQNRKTRQTPGFPDLVAIGHDRILFIEVKSPGREWNLSDAQREFQRECVENGGDHLVASDSVQVFDWLVELGVFTLADA